MSRKVRYSSWEVFGEQAASVNDTSKTKMVFIKTSETLLNVKGNKMDTIGQTFILLIEEHFLAGIEDSTGELLQRGGEQQLTPVIQDNVFKKTIGSFILFKSVTLCCI